MGMVLKLAALFTAVLASVAMPAAAAPPSAAIVVRVEDGNWGNVAPQDIETVLTSVADTLLPYFPQRKAERVSVGYSDQGPSVLMGKARDGAHRVVLKVQDARWDQFTYQFAHELCHVLTNYEHREVAPGTVIRDHQWFEETICETVSLFALNRMATAWERTPPYPEWKSYAPAFRDYAQTLLRERHRQLPPNEDIARWYRDNRESLQRDPYLREKNELLAARLLPLLEATPANLGSIGYLNAAPAIAPNRSLTAYLGSWRDCCPGPHKAFVQQVIALLDGAPSRAASAERTP